MNRCSMIGPLEWHDNDLQNLLAVMLVVIIILLSDVKCKPQNVTSQWTILGKEH